MLTYMQILHKHHHRINSHPTMSPPRGGGRGRGRTRSSEKEPPALSTSDAVAWFAGRLPDDWFVEPPTVELDRDEILVVGELPMPKVARSGDDDADDEAIDPQVAAEARISGFREDTREARMAIADEAQRRFGRTVSWGATCGDTEARFTSANVPVMTRLHLEERQVLDTLIDAGVARSRSEALAWCVKLVGQNEAGWIDKLRTAMAAVEEARNEGPR